MSINLGPTKQAYITQKLIAWDSILAKGIEQSIAHSDIQVGHLIVHTHLAFDGHIT